MTHGAIASRLLFDIKSAIPSVLELQIGSWGQPGTVQVFPESEQAAAQPIIDSFDWSDAAQQAWEEDQNPERKTLRQAAAQAVQDNQDFLAVSSPNNAQVLAQVRKLTQQNNAIIRRLVKID